MGYKNKKHYEHGGGGRRRGGNRRRRRTTPASVHPVRPLDINEETLWQPHRLTARTNEESQEARDARLVLLLLNKLTPDNFDKLITWFLSETTIHLSQERTHTAIHEITERAALDVRYAQVYARLCARLASDLERSSFRETLVQYCCRQDTTLTEHLSTSFPETLLEHPEERNARLLLERRKNVGTKRFIGELYSNGVLELSELLAFVETLLAKALEGSSDEMAIEGLCVLLDACGKFLDENAIESVEMQRCWRALQEMVSGEKSNGCGILSFRMKCIILDLLELRESSWDPLRLCTRQRKELVAGPLERDRQVIRKSKRSGKKGKTVHFA